MLFQRRKKQKRIISIFLNIWSSVIGAGETHHRLSARRDEHEGLSSYFHVGKQVELFENNIDIE